MKVQQFRGFELLTLHDFFPDGIMGMHGDPCVQVVEFDQRLYKYLEGKKRGEQRVCIDRLLTDAQGWLETRQKENEVEIIRLIVKSLEQSANR